MKTSAKLGVEQLESRILFAADLAALADLRALLATYSVDGTGNNLAHPDWGSAGVDLLRIAPAEYADGFSAPAGGDRPSAREISNTLVDQQGQDIVSDRQLSAMIYAWGQFIDHDLGLTPNAAVAEAFNVPVPTGDPSFDPLATGNKTIRLNRSQFDPATGTSDPRQQVNVITAWLDGSMVYGSSATVAAALRTFAGGRLKTDPGGLLPTNNAQNFPGGTLAMGNDAHRVADNQLFAAGDIRANENIELTSLHTLFVREHNLWADRIAARNPALSDEQVFQRARAIVIAEIQAITFNQWLPAVLGRDAIDRYAGYRPDVNPGIANEFSTAAFRFGHSLLGDDVEFLDNRGLPIAEEIPLSEAFSNPDVVRELGIGPILKYLASDPSSELDTKIVGSVRNFLFGEPGAGGLDLASLNIQRGRDHGLADYNQVRQSYGLPRVNSFADISSDPAVQAKLEQLYGSVDNIDLWVGALAEDHVAGASVGPTLRAIISDQFERVRDGDRLWYQNAFSGRLLQQIESTSLADIIRRNTDVANLQPNAFFFRAEISGTVFADNNGNGRRDRGEASVAGQTVELRDVESGEVLASVLTDAQGRYRFGVADGLRTGEYEVRVVLADGSAYPGASRTVAITRGGQLRDRVDLSTPGTDGGTPPCGTPGGTRPALAASATAPAVAAPTAKPRPAGAPLARPATTSALDAAAVDALLAMHGDPHNARPGGRRTVL